MSSTQGKEFVLTDYAQKLIEFKARQLSRRPGAGRPDRDEIRQELWLAVINQADRFDPSRASLDTFIDRVVNSAAAVIVRGQERRKRANGLHLVSLDVPDGDDRSNQPRGAKLSDDDQCRRLGTQRRDAVADREQAEAVASALSHMPPEVSDVCRRVMGSSILSAAKELGTSRRQVRNALAAAEPFLAEAGGKTA